MKLIVHIGVHKTGTTALQWFLYKNRHDLRQRGVWYDPPEGEIHHAQVAQAFMTTNSYGRHVLDQNIRDAIKSGCKICIISSEAFCEHPFEIDEFTKCVKDVDTTILAYIRRPDAMMLSAYNELVRGETSKWTTPIAECTPYDPTYKYPLRHWIGDRPWRLVLAPYDPTQWIGGTLFSDYLNMIHVDSLGLTMSVAEEQSNPSLPPSLIEVLRLLNRLDLGAARRDVVDCLFEAFRLHPELYSGGDLMDDEQRRSYISAFQADISLYERYLRDEFDTSFLTKIP